MSNNKMHKWSAETAVTEFGSTGTHVNGYVSGDLLKASILNTILKEVSKITYNITEKIKSNASADIGPNSDDSVIQNAFENYIKGVEVTNATNATNATSADYATNAGTATNATKAAALNISAQLGGVNQPVYFGADGKPVACTSYDNASVNQAAYASHIGTSSSHPAIGDATHPVYINSSGVPTRCDDMVLDTATKLSNSWSTWTSSTQFSAGHTYLISIEFDSSIFDATSTTRYYRLTDTFTFSESTSHNTDIAGQLHELNYYVGTSVMFRAVQIRIQQYAGGSISLFCNYSKAYNAQDEYIAYAGAYSMSFTSGVTIKYKQIM